MVTNVGEMCPICQEILNAGDTARRHGSTCAARFHSGCINSWLAGQIRVNPAAPGVLPGFSPVTHTMEAPNTNCPACQQPWAGLTYVDTVV